MNVHQNAKLTPAGRALLVERLLVGERAETVAREMGVSRRTAFKWKKRYREEGKAGLEDRSSRPHRLPHRLPRHRRRQIERLRRKRWSTPRIARETGIPLSTVRAECRRLGLGRLPSLEPPVPVVRYERDRPGELVHLDTKKLARPASPPSRWWSTSVPFRWVSWPSASPVVPQETRVFPREPIEES